MLILTAFLAVAGILDHLTHRIPNLLSAGMFFYVIWQSITEFGITSLPGVFFRMIAVAFFLFPFFSIGTLGAGDVKLLAVSAGYFEGGRALSFLFFSFLIACAEGTVMMAAKGQMKKRMLRLAIYIKTLIKTGKIERYHASGDAGKRSGVALAGAMFVSAVLGIGGLY